MRELTVAGAAIVLLCSGAAFAEEKKYDPDKIVCKTQAAEGSRLGTKICKTNKDWIRDKERFRSAIEKKQRDSLMNTPRGG